MATLRNLRKTADLRKENGEEHLKGNLAQNSNAPRSQEGYITQVSEEIKDRVTRKLSQEFGGTESRILDAKSCLEEFLLKPLLRGHSRTTPETSRDALGTKQGTNENDSQIETHPEMSVSQIQTTRIFGPDDGFDTVTGVQEEVTYCSRGKSSEKLKRTQSESQPQLHSESDNWKRPNFVGHSALGKQQQFCKL